MWAAAIAVKSLAFVAAGVTYRRPARIPRWEVAGALALPTVLAAAQVIPSSTVGLATARLALGVLDSTALLVAGIAFWPRRGERVRGLGLLSASFLAWPIVRFGLIWPVPPAVEPALLSAAGLLQGLQSLALVAVVLDRARRRAEFLKDFNDTLLGGMGQGLALVGPDLRIRHANRWLTEHFGPDVLSHTCTMTYLAKAEPCAECPWQDPAMAPRQLTVDGPGQRKLLLTCSPLATPEGPMLLELIGDVTEQEAMRARLLHSERLATVGAMASRVAHEIRNPLGVMAMHADLVRHALAPAGDAGEARHHLTIVTDEIRALGNLVEDYLRFGRLPKPVPEPVDLEALVHRKVEAMRAELGARRVEVRRERCADVPAVFADPDQLGLVFANLFRNAIEAMPEGGRLTLTTSCVDGHVIAEVADTGSGVADTDAEAIFQPFHTTKPHGTGLGLALSREIAQEHGGTLTCRSRSDGATFVLALPAHPKGR
jgi:signal transduction histidine kinase